MELPAETMQRFATQIETHAQRRFQAPLQGIQMGPLALPAHPRIEPRQRPGGELVPFAPFRHAVLPGFVQLQVEIIELLLPRFYKAPRIAEHAHG
jgi:hypothetical protein